MKLKHTFLFMVLFGVVLVAFLSQQKKQVEKVEAVKKTTEDFKIQVEEKSPELKKDEKINLIQVQELSKEETFWLEKQEDVWNLSFPIRGLADQAMAQGMAGMVKLAFNQKLMKPEAGWDEYGLDHPVMKIGVGTTANADRHFLFLGKEAPLGRGIFARWDDRNAYFVLPQGVKSAFQKSVYEMREKRVFLTPVPKMDRIYIEIGDQTFDWSLKNGAWYWLEPISLIGSKIPDDQMMAIIQILSKLYVKEFLDDASGSIYEKGISMISDRIQIRSGKEVETVYFGKEEGLKTAYYAHRENEKKLFLVDQTKVFQILDLLEAVARANQNVLNEAKKKAPAAA